MLQSRAIFRIQFECKEGFEMGAYLITTTLMARKHATMSIYLNLRASHLDNQPDVFFIYNYFHLLDFKIAI